MPVGKYFLIRSRLNPCLAVEPLNGGAEGTPVVMAHRAPEGDGGPDKGSDTQYWYECQVTGTIRNKHSDLCVELSEEGSLKLNSYVEDNKDQEWIILSDRIQDKNDQKLVFQIVEGSSEAGSKLEVAEFTNSDNQLWDFQPQNSEYFHIKSEMHGKVMTVKDAKTTPGAKVFMWEELEEPADNQLWYEDNHAIIRSKLNKFVLQCAKPEKGEVFTMEPFSPGNVNQLWTRYGKCIVSRVHPKTVMVVRKKNAENGAKVVVGEYKDSPHQHWTLEPVFF